MTRLFRKWIVRRQLRHELLRRLVGDVGLEWYELDAEVSGRFPIDAHVSCHGGGPTRHLVRGRNARLGRHCVWGYVGVGRRSVDAATAHDEPASPYLHRASL